MASHGKPPRKRPFKLTPPDPSEDELHSSVAKLLEWVLPHDRVVSQHFPAGGYLLTPAARARLYRLGLRRGMPDQMLWWDGRCLGIELKTPTGRLTADQAAMHKRLVNAGVDVVICRSQEEVMAALKRYSVPHKEVSFGTSRTPITIRTETNPRPKTGEPAELTQGS